MMAPNTTSRALATASGSTLQADFTRHIKAGLLSTDNPILADGDIS